MPANNLCNVNDHNLAFGKVLPKCRIFKYFGSSVVNITATCVEYMNRRITAVWLKRQRDSRVPCVKRMSPKLMDKIYTTTVRPTLTFGSNSSTVHDKFGKEDKIRSQPKSAHLRHVARSRSSTWNQCCRKTLSMNTVGLVKGDNDNMDSA